MAEPARTGSDPFLSETEVALGRAWNAVEMARGRLGDAILKDGRIDSDRFRVNQFAVHGLAWAASYVEAVRQLLEWARRLERQGGLRPVERSLLGIGVRTYLGQLRHGIPLSQSETARPADWLGEAEDLLIPAAAEDAADSLTGLIDLLADGDRPRDGLVDTDFVLIRDQFRRLADSEIAPHAQAWHLSDTLVPLSLVQQLAALGIFGLTLPERFGGSAMGKVAMCIVTEELSRASLVVGSLATRSEIAADLILSAGTPDQKDRFLPGLADGSIIPTAVFTEPEAGSDLAAVATRAVRQGDSYRVTGAKTWSTHAARADLMTLLVRTGATEDGHRGVSILLAEKPRGTERDPFPVPGLSGGEIRTLGYRGMKEYELGFDNYAVPVANLLGSREGEGFRQLMATFETARIQTAARSVGVAQAAFDVALDYAVQRRQFDAPLIAFPRIQAKLAAMAAETIVARRLTWFAAESKDRGERADIQAGMAKLLAARAAWANADSAVQIHGGTGYAEETPAARLLVDARILSVFEGTSEIQADIIARGLLRRDP